jgi:hypothetical protein
MSIYAFVASAGGSIGLLVGGALTEALNWHWIFVINLPIGIAALTLGAMLIPEHRGLGVRGGVVDVWGALLITAAPSLAVYTILHGGTMDGRLGKAFTARRIRSGPCDRLRRRPEGGCDILCVVRAFLSRSRNVAGATLIRAVPGRTVRGLLPGRAVRQRVLGYSPSGRLAFLPMNLFVALFSTAAPARVVARIGAKATVIHLLFVVGGLLLLNRAPVDATYGIDVLQPSCSSHGCRSGLRPAAAAR